MTAEHTASGRQRREEGLATLRDDARRAVTRVENRAHDVAERLGPRLKPRLRGVLHEAAFAVSLVTGTALVSLAPGGLPRTGAAVYAVSVALLFGTSAAYHRGPWRGRSHDVMKRLDHSMIFVLIAGTYTPFALLLLDGGSRWFLLVLVWGGALAGAVLRNVLSRPARWLFVALYNLLGWVAVAFLPQILRAGGVGVLVLLMVGGLFYSAGAVVYALRRPDPSPRWFGFHEVFHACTLVAFAVHYVAVSVATYSAR